MGDSEQQGFAREMLDSGKVQVQQLVIPWLSFTTFGPVLTSENEAKLTNKCSIVLCALDVVGGDCG